MTALRTNLFFVALGLSLLGVVMVYSATWRFSGTEILFMRLAHLGIGIGAFLVVSRVRYTVWRKYANILYGVVLVGLVLVLIPGIGVRVNGSSRWLDVGFMSLQPSEFAKIAAVVYLSCALARLKPGSGLPLKPLAAIGVLFGLVLVEPDFGTSVILLTGVAGALWASEVRTKDLLLSGLAAVAALAAVMLLAPYRRERFLTFLDPWAVADTSGYQNVQAMIAIKSGGIFGSGAGSGGQGANVPEIGTDMIFALVGEELGLLGMIGVIAAFCFIALAGVKIALEAPSVMARCVAAGLTTMLVLQAVFNMGAAMVVLPLAGMTLPFVSYGGSSLLVCFAAVGLLYRISEDSERAREIKPRRTPARADSRGRNGRPRDPRAVRGL
ncbi:MAG: FtsW/RodA/SpoVE family cell cycle protein [Rubrobacter sp.]|nr:FtsW/RodA/SpoVE family cell cycle protein [Rubrobacter sp.]MBA3952453.1 FtsW/RodA/SpoVE family cell cycle protein [Rubrobacter sp.]MDQ3360061.1 FtsW/RodA/SpoVE family cell cycle protein [Actinomycetota bacterium]MDQ3375945.1 FtsW/RodA/SpoVE family cell cycle protein [Actinomycetota bacterium]